MSKVYSIAVVIPVHNECDSIELLTNQLLDQLRKLKIKKFQIILIDDGSTDDSWLVINSLKKRLGQVIVGIKLRKNYGKSIALTAGFSQLNHDLVVIIDADLQNDPADLSKFITAIDEGMDLVSGHRWQRRDPISKTIPSYIFNMLIRLLFGQNTKDINCGFKVFRSEILAQIELYGDMYRFLPIIAHDMGYEVAEIPIRHHSRRYGVSKYSWKRYIFGLIDILSVFVIAKFLQKPNHLFGLLGLIVGTLGTICMIYLGLYWLFDFGPIGTRPLLSFSVLLLILSGQLISFGLLAELINKKTAREDTSHLIKLKI